MDLSWKEGYSVGIEKFDDQHKKLVGIIARLENCYNEKADSKVASQVAGELRDYTVAHFGLEERNMQRHHYPHYDAHKNEHDKFRELTRVLFTDLVLEREKDLYGKLEFLFDWLVNHIGKVDKKYEAFFIERETQIY